MFAEALLRSGISKEALAGACFGLAGADRPQDKLQLEQALKARLQLKVRSNNQLLGSSS